jgi:hypothetical protein
MNRAKKRAPARRVIRCGFVVCSRWPIGDENRYFPCCRGVLTTLVALGFLLTLKGPPLPDDEQTEGRSLLPSMAAIMAYVGDSLVR